MSDAVLYDKATWHSGGQFPTDLPPEAGATHIGMFFSWAITRGLVGDLHRQESADDLGLAAARQITLRQTVERMTDERLTDEDLSPEGNRFAAVYYSAGYYDDLTAFSAELGLPSVYHIPDSWTAFDRLAKVVDRRFKRWKKPGLFGGLFRR